MSPIISFIIPVYNGEKYIERAVKSVTRYSDNEYDVEVVIVNDGSTDKTDSICKLLEQSDERIQYIYQENSGVSKARNNGIKNAQGLFISFIDADDEFLTEKLETILPKLVKAPNDIWAFNYCVVNENGKLLRNMELKLPSTFNASCLRNRFVAYPVLGRLEDSKKYLGAKIYQYIIPRSLLIDNNVCFDENIAFAEDMCFLFTVMSNDTSCHYINEIMYKYYVFSNSVSHTFRDKFYEDWEKVLAYLKKYLSDREFDSVRLGIKSMVHHYYANHYSFKQFRSALNDAVKYTDKDKKIIKECKIKDLYQLFYKYSILRSSTRFEFVTIKLGGKLLRSRDKIFKALKKEN